MSDQQPAHDSHQVPPYASSSPGAYPQPAQQQPVQQRPVPQQPVPQQPAAQGYVLNGHSAHPAQSSAPATGNPAGTTGLILGVIAIVISIASNLVVQSMIYTDGYSSVMLISGFGSLLAFVAGLAALILGLVGLRRPGAPHAAAGIAVGIGIAQVVGILSNYLVNFAATMLHF